MGVVVASVECRLHTVHPGVAFLQSQCSIAFSHPWVLSCIFKGVGCSRAVSNQGNTLLDQSVVCCTRLLYAIQIPCQSSEMISNNERSEAISTKTGLLMAF